MAKPLKILIISAFFPPDNSIGGQRAHAWAKYWGKAGHQVTVLTTPKEALYIPEYFAIAEVRPFLLFDLLKSAYRSFFKPRSAGDISPTQGGKPGLLKRLFLQLKKRGLSTSTRMPDALDFWVLPSVSWAKKDTVQFGRYDIVISSFGPYACHLIAQCLKRKGLCDFWLADFRDTWTQSPYFKGFPIFNSLESFLERQIIEEADAVSIVSQALANDLKRRFPFQDVLTIENGCDVDEISILDKKNIFLIHDKVKFLYTGSLYPGRRDPSFLFSVLKELKEEGVNLSNTVFMFAGPNGDFVMELAEKYDVTDLVLDLGSRYRSESLTMQRDADCLIFIESVAGTLTGKLFEYLHSGTPILGIGIENHLDAGKVIFDSGTGISVGNDREHLKKLMREGLERKFEFYNPIQSEVDKYSRKTQAGNLLEWIKTQL